MRKTNSGNSELGEQRCRVRARGANRRAKTKSKQWERARPKKSKDKIGEGEQQEEQDRTDRTAWQRWKTVLHVLIFHTTAYHPQTNGLVEKFNHTVQSCLLRVVSEHQNDWDDSKTQSYLPSRHLNTSQHVIFLSKWFTRGNVCMVYAHTAQQWHLFRTSSWYPGQ